MESVHLEHVMAQADFEKACDIDAAGTDLPRVRG
jgi:hypothetical protein